MNYDMKRSGERIRQLRIRNCLTQEKTANMLNVDQSFYGRVETGKKGCSVDMFIQLSALFGVSLDYSILGKFPDDLSREADTVQLKTDIEELIGRLEQFRQSL